MPQSKKNDVRIAERSSLSTPFGGGALSVKSIPFDLLSLRNKPRVLGLGGYRRLRITTHHNTTIK